MLRNYQIFGFNPAYPNFAIDDPPALEEPKSKIVEMNLKAMRVAKEEFMQKDSDERLKRALKHNIRENKLAEVVPGDKVFYKRNLSNEWRGPASVIVKDGSQILVRHGGNIVRVHSVRLKKFPGQIAGQVETPTRLEPVDSQKKSSQENYFDENDSEDQEENPEAKESEGSEREQEGGVSSEVAQEAEINGEGISDEEFLDAVASSPVREKALKFKIGQRISGTDKETGELVSGRILSRAGKVSGKHKN